MLGSQKWKFKYNGVPFIYLESTARKVRNKQSKQFKLLHEEKRKRQDFAVGNS